MQKRFVIRRFVHAAVQLTTSLAERVRSINGDGAPFRCPQDIILKSPRGPLCLHPDILFLQPSNAKQALLEETIQKKCFGDQLGLNCNYKRKDKSMDRKIRKNDWCCAILSAKLLLLSKAALTVLC